MPPRPLLLQTEMLSKGMWRSSSKQSRCLHLQSPANISTCSRNLHLRPSSNRLHCRLILSPTIRSHQNPLPRTPLNTFSTTPHPSKKATKSTRIRGHSPTEATVAGTTDSPSTDNPSENDPYDFSTLESGIAKAVERLKDALGKLRAGGRFNPEIIERLKVQLKAGEGRQGEKVKIETVDVGDLAQVVPKGGRSVVVLVGDEDHVKPISAAIQGSNLSLTPQPDKENPLQLNVPIPPPTAESRAQVQATAKKAWEAAGLAVRTARGDCQKRLRKLEVGKKVRPDDVRKAQDEMEKVAKKGQDECKTIFDGAVKGLERG